MKYVYIFLIIFSFGCSHEEYELPHVIIDTELGEIEIEIYSNKAPLTSNAFLKNISEGNFEDASFYRVLASSDFPGAINPGLIQGGIHHTNSKKNISAIPHESTELTGLSHTNGIVSMARLDTGTATTEFFICIGDQSPLDHGRRGTADSMGMAAFGKVFKGMDVVKKIQSQPRKESSLVNAVKIKKIKIINPSSK